MAFDSEREVEEKIVLTREDGIWIARDKVSDIERTGRTRTDALAQLDEATASLIELSDESTDGLDIEGYRFSWYDCYG